MCERCGSNVKSENWTCVKCGSPQSIQGGDGYSSNKEHCYRCKTPIDVSLIEYEQFNPKNKRKQDWSCKKCGAINPKWSNSCRKCGDNKPDTITYKVIQVCVYVLLFIVATALSIGLVNWCVPHTPSRPYHNIETGEGQYEYGGSKEQKRDLERIDDYLKNHPDE